MIMENELFTRRALTRLLVPIVIEQVLAVSIGMADTIMVASLGESAVSSVSLVDNINILLIQIFSALASGGAVIAAQYIGRGDQKNANSAAKQLMYSSFFITLIITALSLIFNNQILSTIYQQIEPDVMNNSMIYYYITALSFPFLAIYNACAGLFRAMGNSKVTMYISILMNLLNISGNAILLYGLHFGVEGAAIPTFLSRAVGAVIMLMLIRHKDNKIYIEKIFNPEIDFKMIKRILKIGVPNGLENGMFQIGKLLVSGMIAALGTASIAANAVANSITGIAMIPGSAIGVSMITVVGQCVGAGEYDQAMKYTKRLMTIMFAAMGFLNVVLFLITPTFVTFYNLSDGARTTTIEILRIYALMAATVWPLSFGLPNALRASGDAKFTMLTSIMSMWVFRIGFSYLLILFFDMGLHGVWIAMYIDWIVRASILTVRFLRGKWKSIRVI